MKKILRRQNWDANFRQLQKYYEIHGHIHVPNIKQYSSLRAWRRYQTERARQDRLPDDQREKLKSLGMFGETLEEKWLRNFDKLVAFHEEHDHFRVPRTGDTSALAHWLRRQKQQKKQGRLRVFYERKLRRLGVPYFEYEARQ
ncbi:hypothetical protein GUA87_03775 [Sneathiella sp. P13V-1]|uniref:helicase associated domain-containing protein n=1 Tax=Sneathiella sp. P13V-1 TaxID=2697366 RepID=UPI00187BAE2C|nr:helicase associated domain-containing protein [Sneathiella sp. P13V-1]MBE7635949.1 hypothetical protein [Sneathiella sp. P13V-1]